MHFLEGHDHPVRQLAYSATGRLLASADDSGRVVLWDLHSGEQVREYRAERVVEALAFHPREEPLLAAALPDGKIVYWGGTGPDTPKPPAEGLYLSRVRHLCFTRDGKRLLAAGDMRDRQGTLAFRWADGGHLYRRGGHGLTMSACGGDVASSSDTGSIFVWHSPTPLDMEHADFRYRQRLTGHARASSVLAFTREGRALLSALPGEVTLWDLALGHPRPLPAPPGDERPLAFAPDGARLLTADDNGVLRLREPSSGVALAALDWQLGPIATAVFSPDGMTAAVAGKHGPVVVWDVEE